MLTTALAGVLTVTLLPGAYGNGSPGSCDQGLPGFAFLASASARLNVLPCFLAVLLFRRPLLVLAGAVALTGGTELVQGHLSLGRACSYDDVKANVLGGVIGVLLGCLFLWGRRRRPPFTWRDTMWGLGALVLTTCAVAAAFPCTLTVVDIEATADRTRARFGDTRAMQQWFAGTVTEIHGVQTDPEMEIRMPEPGQDRWLLRAVTERGSVVATWPDRKLVEIKADGRRGEAGFPAGTGSPSGAGPLSDTDLRKAAERFAHTWFPAETAHADARFQHLRNEPDARLLSYPRLAHGARSPIRLDIVVSTSGRVTGLTAKALP
ncbi:hypothetical protein [Streptomyces sp. NPDC052496]|uniref:VanZ family protein n=1 Tax=Streptomyces sp. NPDC052496 TaxID=3154951 RepID=UPI00341C9B31